MIVYRTDRAALAPCTRRGDGAVVADCHLTRAGVFVYLLPDGTERRELRPESEVFDPVSVRSADGVALTNEHPADMLSARTVDDLACGAVCNPHRDEDHLRALLVVHDRDTIDAMERGKLHLSMGYVCDCDERPGVHPVYGRYDAIQRRVRYNHAALVHAGRAGTATARMDRYGRMVATSWLAPPRPAGRGDGVSVGRVDVDAATWKCALRLAYAAADRAPDDDRRVDAYQRALADALDPAVARIRADLARTILQAPPAQRAVPARTDHVMSKPTPNRRPTPRRSPRSAPVPHVFGRSATRRGCVRSKRSVQIAGRTPRQPMRCLTRRRPRPTCAGSRRTRGGAADERPAAASSRVPSRATARG